MAADTGLAVMCTNQIVQHLRMSDAPEGDRSRVLLDQLSEGLGKEEIKRVRASPDGFFQLAMQIAFTQCVSTRVSFQLF